MATAFINHQARAIGTTQTWIVDGSTTYADGITGLSSGKAVIMIGLMISNILTTSVNVTVVIGAHDTNNHTHLCKDVTIPAGDSIEIVQGKIVLESGEDIGVTASAASAVDVCMSILKDA